MGGLGYRSLGCGGLGCGSLGCGSLGCVLVPTNPQPDERTNITLYVFRYTEGLPHWPRPRASNKLKRALPITIEVKFEHEFEFHSLSYATFVFWSELISTSFILVLGC